MKQKTILLCDGYSLFMRNYMANPRMDNNGNPVGGIAGFLIMLGKICYDYNPDEAIIAWEGGGAQRRRAIFPDYKKGRVTEKLNRFYEDDIPDSRENEISQVIRLTKILHQLPITQVYVSAVEADDVIGYVSKYTLKGDKVVIVSSDKDMYQLVSDDVVVWSPGQKKEIGVDDILKKFSIHPNNFCLARAIAGDKSDNLEGISGAGYRTLAKRFPGLFSAEEMDFDEILRICNERIKTSKVKVFRNILDGEEIIRRNLKLMRLDVANLSGTHIQKINSIIETSSPKYDRIGFMRGLIKCGIQDINTDRLFSSMNHINRQRKKV